MLGGERGVVLIFHPGAFMMKKRRVSSPPFHYGGCSSDKMLLFYSLVQGFKAGGFGVFVLWVSFFFSVCFFMTWDAFPMLDYVSTLFNVELMMGI